MIRRCWFLGRLPAFFPRRCDFVTILLPPRTLRFSAVLNYLCLAELALGHGFLPRQNAVLPCVFNECPVSFQKHSRQQLTNGRLMVPLVHVPTTQRHQAGVGLAEGPPGEQVLREASPSVKTLGTPGGFKALLANGASPLSMSLILWPWPPSASIQDAGRMQRAVRVPGSRDPLGQPHIQLFNPAGPSRDHAQKKGCCE